MSDVIDPDELPFTRDEIARAYRLFHPAETAEYVADHLAECGPGMIEDRAERRKQWEAAGIPNAATKPLHGWHYDEQLLPALASLSANVAERVESLVRARWDRARSARLNELRWKAAEAARLIPSREELLHRLESGVSGAPAMAVSGLTLPQATAEMEEQAQAAAAVEEAKFRQAVESFRRGSEPPSV